MTVNQIQSKINDLKKENDVCVLAHSYQAREIVEIADFTGDSFLLSQMAQKTKQKNIIMCGVKFMAETVKILSPDKNVYLANTTAGCPMAEQMDKELIQSVKAKFPNYTIVAYINTTADLKTICDVCVTSSSAVKIVNKIKNPNILFIPDCNLGAYVSKQLPNKNIKLLQGGCPIHAIVSLNDIKKSRLDHPNAEILTHPECSPEVVEASDFVGSTSEIMNYAVNSTKKEFIIGTEMSIAEHLQYICEDKKFYVLSKKLLCPNMKSTTLVDVLNCIKEKSGEINLDDQTISKARICIDKMIEMG